MVISRVIKGEKKARKIGFKTANFKINDYCNLLYGVYFVNVTILDSRIDNKFKGIANYGVKPTFTNNEPLLEVHLFNFDEEIYGKKLRIEFVKLVREEKKFESIEKLKDQIILDNGSISNISEIPSIIKQTYKTAWDLSMKTLIDQAAAPVTNTPVITPTTNQTSFFGEDLF